MKNVFLIVGGIVLVGILAAGSFWAGMTYQGNQADQVRQRFMSERGIPADGAQLPEGGMPGERQFLAGGVGFPGGGTMGVIKSIDGLTMTLSTAENVTTVHLAEDTPVQKTATTGIEELQTGMQVMVRGEQDKNGEITASQVSIVDGTFLERSPGSGEAAPAP
jgi:hypothetical protein